MPRATAFHRADVWSRWILYDVFSSLNPEVIEKIKAALKLEAVATANVEQLVFKIEQALRTYNATVLANYQESPARKVAALKPGLALGKRTRLEERMRRWLNTLPPSLRLELKAEYPFDELLARVKSRAEYWQTKARVGPVGHGAPALSLRDSLRSVLAKDIYNAHKIDRAVANILRAVGIKFPAEKKNRGRFTGTKCPK